MSLHCDHCGAEVDATVRFEEDDDRGIWLRCTNSDCDRSGRFGGDGIRVVDRGRGVATDGGAEVTDATIHHYECQGCGAELDWVEIDTCPSCGSDELKEIHVIADGGEVSESFERPGRPDPEDDPYSCSICGAPLGEVSRVEGFDHCRGCRREHGPDEHTEIRTDGGQEVSRNQHPVYKQELLEEAKDAQEPVTDVERTHEGQCITVAACQEHDGIGWLCTIEDDRRFDGEPRVNFLKSRWDSDLEVMRKWSRQAAGRSSAPERKPGWDSLFTVYNTASHVYRQEVDDA